MVNQKISYQVWDKKNDKEILSFESLIEIPFFNHKGKVFDLSTDHVKPRDENNLFDCFKDDFANNILEMWEHKQKHQNGEYKIVNVYHFIRQGFNMKMDNPDPMKRYQTYNKITIQVNCVPYVSIKNRLKYFYWGLKRRLRK